jgi:hypothetical protein
MATTSKFISLSSSILLEYIYSDQSAINTPGNVFRLNTNTNPIWLLNDGHTGEDTVLNADSCENLNEFTPNGTGNVRNRSYAKINASQAALLSLNKVVFYNDYDSELTSTPSLPINFTGSHAPVYDTIRLHLVQGFNFETYLGLTLNVKAKNKNGKNFNLANLVYNHTDHYETLNPSSFFFGGRVYNSYIELRVLSLFNLISDYWLGVLNGDTVVEKITRGIGVQRDQQIQLSFSWVNGRKTVDDQDYINLYDTINVDLPVRDQFELIAAFIQEATDGDYIEFYGTYNGEIINQFITDINSNGYDFMLLHDITVSEYIYDAQSGSRIWQVTDQYELSQTSNYDVPNRFRPVILHPSAISFKIDYVVRLYNRNDNSQIWKASSMISYATAKYGKILQSISLGENPVQSVIYNQNIVKDITINSIAPPVLSNTKYITSFLDNTQISISTDTLNPGVDSTSNVNSGQTTINQSSLSSGSSRIYSNGLGKILISNTVTYLKFVIYQKSASSSVNTPLNLSGIGELNLSFTSDTNERLTLNEYPNTFTSKSRGEIIFRLTDTQANQVLKFSSREFKIFLVNEKGESTFLYVGNFYSQDEWLKLAQTDKITSLEKQLSDQITINNSVQSLLSTSNSKIQSLSTSIQSLSNQISSNLYNESTTVTNLQNQINSMKDTIVSLNNQITELNKNLTLSNSSILLDNGMISTLAKQANYQTNILNTNTEPVPTKSNIEQQLSSNASSVKSNVSATYTQAGGGGGNSYQ